MILGRNTISFNTGIFGQRDTTPLASTAPALNQLVSAAGRLTETYGDSNHFLEIGVSVFGLKFGTDESESLDNQPESDVTNVELVNTGTFTYNRSHLNTDLEGIALFGPFSLQGEWLKSYYYRHHSFTTVTIKKVSTLVRVENPNLTFHGGYLQASWVLTGESRSFDPKEAIFHWPKPEHCYGAWELAARYSTINLNSGPVRGGTEHNASLVLNWYVNSYVRFEAEYIKVYSLTQNLPSNPSIFSIRAIMDFARE